MFSESLCVQLIHNDRYDKTILIFLVNVIIYSLIVFYIVLNALLYLHDIIIIM